MSIVMAAGFVLLLLMVSSRQESFWRKTILGSIEIVLIFVTVLALYHKDELFLEIPGTRVETLSSVSVSKSGSMYLESSQSPFIENKFYVTEDNSKEVAKWLADTSKSVYIKIVAGDKLLYSRNLGVYKEGMEEDIQKIYSSWQSKGLIPLGKKQYWFFVFYLEV